MGPPRFGVNSSDTSIDGIDHHIGGELFQTDFHIQLQRLHRLVNSFLNIAINFL